MFKSFFFTIITIKLFVKYFVIQLALFGISTKISKIQILSFLTIEGLPKTKIL